MRIVLDFVKEEIGAKAYNLVQLNEAGLRVPPFIIFEFDFFKEIETIEFLKKKQAELENNQPLRKVSDDLREWLDDQFAHENKDEFMNYLASMTDQDEFSVRSSASAEDGEDISFAGQFETILHVRKSHLLNEVKLVLKSLYRESVLAYIKKHQLSIVDMKMNVIIQSMITGTMSGVYFTANPKGLLNEHVVVIGEGVGANIVEDKVPTTTITYHPVDDIFYYEKTEDSPLISDLEWRQLTEMADKVNDYFGPAMDIEFTFYQDRLYILQLRPITSLPKGERIVLDNSNIVESYPGVSSPLTISFVKEAYRNIMRSLAQRLLVNEEKTIQAYEDTFKNMIAPVNNRLYYQIQNWYQLLQLLPFHKKLIPIWQDMLGVTNREIPETPIKITKKQRSKLMMKTFKEFLKADKNMEELNRNFIQIEELYYDAFANEITYQTLWDLYDQLNTTVMGQWDITLMNDLNAFVYTGLLKKFTRADNGQTFIAGIDQIESLKPVKAMHSIVNYLQEDSNREIKEEIIQLEDEDVWDFIASTDDPVIQEIKQFVALYGDRAPEELKLETHTFRTHPELFIQLLKQHLLGEANIPQLPDKLDEKALESSNPFIAFLQRGAKKGIEHRESSRLNRTRLYGMARSIFLEIASLLEADGRLENAEDVFFLNLDELRAISFNEKIRIDSAKLDIRRQEYEQNKQLPAYSRLEFVGEIFDSFPQNINYEEEHASSRTLFNGIGCSNGQVQGEILLVEDVKRVKPEDARDKIIVTKMTDPGWVYLLASAKGIIAEKGSLLSHTAIVSRELDIPAIVNVKNAMTIFREGEIVEINGQTGRIRRLEV